MLPCISVAQGIRSESMREMFLAVLSCAGLRKSQLHGLFLLLRLFRSPFTVRHYELALHDENVRGVEV